jgi:hypothetical protein
MAIRRLSEFSGKNISTRMVGSGNNSGTVDDYQSIMNQARKTLGLPLLGSTLSNATVPVAGVYKKRKEVTPTEEEESDSDIDNIRKKRYFSKYQD